MTPPSPEQQIRQMATAYWQSQMLFVAAKLGIADHLSEGPRTADELAQATDSHPEALYRLLRALAAVGVFAEDESGSFHLTPLAEPLRTDHPASQRDMVLMMGDEHYVAWGELLYSVQTGNIAFDKIYGQPVFEYYSEHPDKAQIFDGAMTALNAPETVAMLAAYDFSGIGTLADIGGGNGSLLVEVLKRYPTMRGLLYDQPHVIERAQAHLSAAGVADRCQTVAGNFFESIPAGADAYLLRHIIHDWTDEQSQTILQNCRQAMQPQNRLLIVECVIPPGNDFHFGKLLDLNMLVLPGGKERTAEQFRHLLAESGLQLTQIVTTENEICIIEAQRID